MGLSGGIDSAVVVRLAQMAVQDQMIGVLMPCHSDPRDEADARLVADHFEHPDGAARLAPAFDRLSADLKAALGRFLGHHRPRRVPTLSISGRACPLANVKPRLRMTSLYFVANSLNYLVAGTGNRAELTIGYFTKYGDGGVDMLPIGNLLKSEVRALARSLDVPAAIIDKPPSAGLWLGQTDEAEMGFTYADLENYLTHGPEAVAPALAMRIERLVRASDHKRSLAPAPDAERLGRIGLPSPAPTPTPMTVGAGSCVSAGCGLAGQPAARRATASFNTVSVAAVELIQRGLELVELQRANGVDRRTSAARGLRWRASSRPPAPGVSSGAPTNRLASATRSSIVTWESSSGTSTCRSSGLSTLSRNSRALARTVGFDERTPT